MKDEASLIAAVREMRHCQREYFRTRSADWLEKAKRAERLVDADLVALDAGQGAQLPLVAGDDRGG